MRWGAHCDEIGTNNRGVHHRGFPRFTRDGSTRRLQLTLKRTPKRIACAWVYGIQQQRTRDKWYVPIFVSHKHCRSVAITWSVSFKHYYLLLQVLRLFTMIDTSVKFRLLPTGTDIGTSLFSPFQQGKQRLQNGRYCVDTYIMV